MICSVGELNALDLGVHMQVMEEWNEVTFDWQPALVVLHGYYTRVIQEDHGVLTPSYEATTRDGQSHGLYIATYVSNGEGDLRALRVLANVSEDRFRNPAPHSEDWVKKATLADMLVGTEYWYHDGKEPK